MDNQIIYCFQNKINSFNSEFLKKVSIKGSIKSYFYTTIVCKTALIFTSDKKEDLIKMKIYYEEKSIKDFIGPVILIDLAKKVEESNIFWIDKRNNLLKGVNDNKDTVYKYGNSLIKVDNKGHIIDVYYEKDINRDGLLLFLIKIIEGAIIEQHIKLGLFPIHASMISYKKENYLILGNSQCGKTSLMNLFNKKDKEYKCISDDIVFMDIYGKAYPFGQYEKNMVDSNKNNSYEEKYEGIVRSVKRINNIYNAAGLTVNMIFLPGIKNIEKAEVTEVKDAVNEFFDLVSVYPNDYFIKSDFNYSQAVLIVDSLMKSQVFRIDMAYGKNNDEVVDTWMDIIKETL